VAYELSIAKTAREELKALKAFDRNRIMDSIEKQLIDSPTVVTRNRKLLGKTKTSFAFVPPLWELRVGDYRVFYDVDEAERVVSVRSVRRKLADQTTEDVTNA
jgi:mRNA-degrading endonuclease RelE of RelBE toxin-antitoxin system